MDWLDRLNEAMHYIEQHLDDDIDETVLARLTLCQSGMFQRIFFIMTDMTLSEYIRRRRLSMAAMELVSGRARVIDLAMRFGYESPDAFTVAFKKLHGVTPSAARAAGVPLKAWPPLAFTLSIKGVEQMDYRIEKKPMIKLAGKQLLTSNNQEQQFVSIPAFWETSHFDGSIDQIRQYCRCEGGHLNGCMLGVCSDMQDNGSFLYTIAVEYNDQPLPPGLVVMTLPEATWMIFSCRGPMPDAIQQTWKRIMTEILPASPYRHAGSPDMEVYSQGDGNRADYYSEVWIPIVEK